MWDTITNTKRKKVIAFLVISGLLLIPIAVVYATAYTQDITETLSNITFQPANLYQHIGETLSNIVFQNKGNTQTPHEILYSICVNFTRTILSCGSADLQFGLVNTGSVQTINVTTNGCTFSPLSVVGDGKPHPITFISGYCSDFTFTLPTGYVWNGTSSDAINSAMCLNCTINLDYTSQNSIQTQTQIVMIYQTETIQPNLTSCKNTTACANNQLSGFVALLLPTLVLMAVGCYALLQMGVKDERVYIFMLMMAITGSAFLSSAGGFSIYAIPWYIAIFIDIIGFLLIMVHKN